MQQQVSPFTTRSQLSHPDSLAAHQSMQQSQQQLGVGASGANASANQQRDVHVIREVWAHNFEVEMAYIRELIVDYPYVGMVCNLLLSM